MTLQDWFALGQLASGIIALVIAIVAIRIGYSQARKSGEDVFQLTVLRDLLTLTDRAGQPDPSAATARLAMLPEDHVPFWREWVRSRPDLDPDRGTDEMIDQMKPPEGLTIEDRYRWAFREDIRRTVGRKGHRTSRPAHPPSQQFWAVWR